MLAADWSKGFYYVLSVREWGKERRRPSKGGIQEEAGAGRGPAFG